MGDKKIEISVKAIQKIMTYPQYECRETMLMMYIYIVMQCNAIDSDNFDTYDMEFVSVLNLDKELVFSIMEKLKGAGLIEIHKPIKLQTARAYNLRIVGV